VNCDALLRCFGDACMIKKVQLNSILNVELCASPVARGRLAAPRAVDVC